MRVYDFKTIGNMFKLSVHVNCLFIIKDSIDFVQQHLRDNMFVLIEKTIGNMFKLSFLVNCLFIIKDCIDFV